VGEGGRLGSRVSLCIVEREVGGGAEIWDGMSKVDGESGMGGEGSAMTGNVTSRMGVGLV